MQASRAHARDSRRPAPSPRRLSHCAPADGHTSTSVRAPGQVPTGIGRMRPKRRRGVPNNRSPPKINLGAGSYRCGRLRTPASARVPDNRSPSPSTSTSVRAPGSTPVRAPENQPRCGLLGVGLLPMSSLISLHQILLFLKRLMSMESRGPFRTSSSVLHGRGFCFQ